MELEVDIEKRLPGFTLAAKFCADAEPLGILGASGSGKTMTLRCIAGLDSPTRGRIVLNGRVLFDSAAGANLPSRARRVGLLFQHYALFPHLSVAQNVAFGFARLPRAERNLRVAEQLARVHLEGLEGRYPHELSGGQQQRVALARALATQPEALLLDEPFSALDTHLRSQMERQLMEALAAYRGVTLFVSHNLEEAYRVCRELLVLSEGKGVACGAKEEIFRRPPSLAVARLTGCKNFSRARAVAPDRVEALDWGCTLHASQTIPEPPGHVAIRAHHIRFPDAPSEQNGNTFRCWLVQSSETPFRMTLYLRLHSPPADVAGHHLQAEVTKETWAALKDRAFPWQVHLDPQQLFLLPD